MGATVEQVEIDGMFYCNHNDIQVDCKVSQWNKTKKSVFVPGATVEQVKKS